MTEALYLIRQDSKLHRQTANGIYELSGNAASLDWILSNVRATDLLQYLKGAASKEAVDLKKPYEPQ